MAMRGRQAGLLVGLALSLKDVSFDTALRVLLRQANLTYSGEAGDVYMIKPRCQETTATATAPETTPAVDEEDAAP